MISEKELGEIKNQIWEALKEEWKARNPMFTPQQYAHFYHSYAKEKLRTLIIKYRTETILNIAKQCLSDVDFEIFKEIIQEIGGRVDE